MAWAMVQCMAYSLHRVSLVSSSGRHNSIVDRAVDLYLKSWPVAPRKNGTVLAHCMQMCTCVCWHVYRHVCRHVCATMCVDNCITICVDICADMCVDMCVDMHGNMFGDTCVDMCVDMNVDMGISVCVDMCAPLLQAAHTTITGSPHHYCRRAHRSLRDKA